MDSVIYIVTIVLIVGYAALAIWLICSRRSVWGSIGTSAGMLLGGLVFIPVAETVATFICWAAVAAIVLAVIGGLCS